MLGRCLVVTSVLAVNSIVAAGQERRPAPRERFPASLDAYIAGVRESWNVPAIAIAVVRNDSTLVAKAYGVRELGKPGTADANTVFDIASLSKSFTATAAGILVDQGKLRWDEPIRTYLPDLILPNDTLTRAATVRDFLAHRTGLDAVNMMWIPTAVTRTEIVRRMRYVPVVAPFRQNLVYSNIGYSVAGEAIAAAARMPFENVLRDLVIKPLRLSSTTWSYEQTERMPNVAASHAMIDGRLQMAPRELQRPAIAPAAAVQSTVTDLARWMRLHLNNGVLDGQRYVSDSTMRAIHSVVTKIPPNAAFRAARLVMDTVTGYGMGWQIMDYRGHRLWWHTGNGNGSVAYMALFPNERLGIVVLVNTWSAGQLHMALLHHMADVYLGYEPRAWVSEELPRRDVQDRARAAQSRAMVAMRSSEPPPAPLSAYAGRYDHPLFGPIWIRRETAGLTMQMGEGQMADLEYHGNNAFYVSWRDPLFREYFGGEHLAFTMRGDSIASFTTTMNRDSFTAMRGR